MKQLFLFLFALPLLLFAQNPKQANQAVVTITTFDQQGNPIQQSLGFIHQRDNRIVAPFAPFKGAARAEVTNWQGQKANVSRILGASSLHDVVVARLDRSLPKATVLRSAPQAVQRGTMGLLQTSKIEGKTSAPEATAIATVEQDGALSYYTLTTPNEARYFGTPVLTARGEVFGMVQRNLLQGAITACAIDIAAADSLRIGSTSAFNADLNAIAIPKAIPTDAPTEAYTYIYMVSRSAQDSTLVVTALNDFVAAYPDNAVVYGDAATFYANRGDFASADAWLQRGLAKGGDNRAVLYDSQSTLIYTFAAQGHPERYPAWTFEAALDAARNAYAVSPQPAYAQQQGFALYALKRYPEALEQFQRVNASAIASPRSFLYAANTLEQMEGDQRAARLAMLDSALNRCVKPYNAEAIAPLYARAQLLTEMGQYRQAVADYTDYEKVLGRDNLTAYFYYLRSQVEVQTRMFQQAIDDLSTAISLARTPAEWEGYKVEQALLYLQVVHFDEAIAVAREVVARNADNVDAHKVLGVAYGEKKQKKLAQQHLKRAAELGDENAVQLMKKYK